MNQIVDLIVARLHPETSDLGKHLLQHLKQDQSAVIIKALKEYQNDDGGFAHGLEVDLQLPLSNVASTTVAITLLEDIQQSSKKAAMIKDIIHYLETVYEPMNYSFPFVPKEVDDYPHAVWWNWNTLDNFTYGNPNPEVAGFLYQYQEYVTKIDVEKLIAHIMKYVTEVMVEKTTMHSVLSLCKMYTRVDEQLKAQLREPLQFLITREVEWDSTKWDEYCLEPYKVFEIVPEFFQDKMDIVLQNLDKYITMLKHKNLEPNWTWWQYEDVFQNVKKQWVPFIHYGVMKAYRNSRKR